MHVRLKRVIIGTDLTGMILAPTLSAVFIPVSFCPSFGWEYADFTTPLLEQACRIQKIPLAKVTRKNRDFEWSILKESETIYPNLFYWEIEKFYKTFLNLNSLIYDNFQFETVELKDKTLHFRSTSNNELSVTFDQCWIINPGDHFLINNFIDPIESTKSTFAHVLYHMQINLESKDSKAIQQPCDMMNIDFDPFSKIWFSCPFGMKKYDTTTDPIKKKKVFSTKDITFICENIPIENLEDEKFEIYSIRNKIYQVLSGYKRIAERSVSYEKDIAKFILSTNLDFYADTDNVKFIYYEDKSEIICPKNLDVLSWPPSSQRILYQIMYKTINSLSLKQPLKKQLF